MVAAAAIGDRAGEQTTPGAERSGGFRNFPMERTGGAESTGACAVGNRGSAIAGCLGDGGKSVQQHNPVESLLIRRYKIGCCDGGISGIDRAAENVPIS